MSSHMPVLFVAHGAPVLLDDPLWMNELAQWGAGLPKPTAILMLSAHWVEERPTLGATEAVPLVYDFYGFPARYYQTTYPAPGAPALAARVRARLAEKGIAFGEEPERGLDHGAYIPLVAMFPLADIPVLQLSLPPLDPAGLVALGRALAPLREEGVLILASGFLTHNMEHAFVPGIPDWAHDFDDWVADALTRFDLPELMAFERQASAKQALPTWEHYAPLLVAAGAAEHPAEVVFPVTGFWMGSAFTKRSVEFR